MNNRYPIVPRLHPRLAWLVLILGSIVSTVQGTPPLDPICGTANSLAYVLERRAQRMAANQAPRRLVRPQQAGDPVLNMDWSDPLSGPRLVLQGTSGQTYQLENTTDLSSGRWDPVLLANLNEQPLVWSDELLGESSRGFYRLRGDVPWAFEELASNFRLLDARGIARDLYYPTHLNGVAVVAAGTNLNSLAALAPLLTELGRTYTNEVETWILLSDPAPIRSNILAQAKSLGLAFPVLLDSSGLAAGAVGLTRAGQVALVRSRDSDYTVAYRGEVVEANGSTPTESLLGHALASLVKGTPATFLRTPGRGAVLTHVGQDTPDYARDIAPMLYQYCAKCHREGGVAPFAMTHHGVIAEWAPAIKHAVLSRRMPPWHADPEYGHFANDLSVPGPLKSALIRWIDAGAPRGGGSDPLQELAPPPAFDRWPEDLGEPDTVVTIPLQSVKASGTEPYRYVFARLTNTTTMWIKAAVVRPSNYKAVHHYLVWLNRITNSGTDGNSTYEPHLAEFVPGYEPFRFPADAGVRLSRSNWITFNLHYTPYGVETNDQPVLALWYHKTAPAKSWTTESPGNGDFSIPPNARDHGVEASMTLTQPITLYRLNPHMHLRGKRMKYEVLYPGGRREVLLSVPDYDFGWQVGYALAKPKYLAAGSTIFVSGAFDNSAQNLANPNPSARVLPGDQSSAEMFVGFMDYTQ